MLSDNYSGPSGTGVTAPSGRRIWDVGQGRRGALKRIVKDSAKKFADAATIEKREDLISTRGKNLTT
jgi:hypothetical protein